MRSTIAKYILSWFGLMVLAIINGTIRDFGYKESLGSLTAHQVSTVTLLILFSLALWFMVQQWPLSSNRQAWTIGIAWFVMTELFEFGMGLSRGASWEELMYVYDITQGQVWLLIPLWVLVGPAFFRRFVQSRTPEQAA